VQVAEAAPGIFTAEREGKGSALVFNQDGSRNSTTNPALKGSIISFYVTGEGRPAGLGVDGMIAAPPYSSPSLPVVVGVNHEGIEVVYAGAAPGFVSGLMQVNARLRPQTPSGDTLPLVIRIGGSFSASVTFSVR
jgi:uncharacterized protein (TIGR03437 family)